MMQDLFAARIDAQSQLDEDLEDYRRQVVEAAQSEHDYRVLLAQRMTALHAAGVAWTVCSDIARGQEDVADLRMRRDCDEGLLDACHEALNVHKRTLDYINDDIKREWSIRHVN